MSQSKYYETLSIFYVRASLKECALVQCYILSLEKVG